MKQPDSLTRLHAELSTHPRLDDESRHMLAEVMEGKKPPSGIESLAVRFEAGHPTLAASLREFVELLGGAGI
jgi:hypothetical protein